MAKRRLVCLAALSALLASSCGDRSSQPAPFSTAPTAPTTITPRSDLVADDDPPAALQLGVDLIIAGASKAFTASGVVTDKAHPAWKISGAAVTVTPGSQTARTSATGQYTLRLSAGTYTIKISKSGYATTSISKTISGTTTVDAALTATPPPRATARCKDRTWSQSLSRARSCASHEGVAYWVCPGKLCPTSD